MADEEAASPVQESAAEAPAAKAVSTAAAAAASATAEAPVDATPEASAANDGPPTAEAPAAQDQSQAEDSAATPPSPGLTIGPVMPISDEIRRILRLEVPVIVKLADKRLSLGDIIDLSPGSIVEFTKSAEQSLELMVNNKMVGRGVAVKVGEKFGLRIDEILPVSQTIRSLGN
jgi:flagellar motor switch protein FliN/FliY